MLKKFSKSFLIYGVAPTFGKFVGIFLIPIYTRVFTTEQYGVIDIFNVAIFFLSILINLQIYAGVSRYFYDCRDTTKRKELVSTALWVQVILSAFIMIVLLLFSNSFNTLIFNSLDYTKVYYIVIFWLPTSCLYTYLSVIIRFKKKPKKFLYVTLAQVIVKISVSLIAILVLNSGIIGVFIGQLTGSVLGIVLLFVLVKDEIGFVFKGDILNKLLRFSLPLVPTLILLRAQQPLLRMLIIKYLSLSDIGVFAVGMKIVSVFMLINTAFRMTWNPFLYENYSRGDAQQVFNRILKMMNISTAAIVLILILFSGDILSLVTTDAYLSAGTIVAFVSIKSMFDILKNIIGIGPRLTNKTGLEVITAVLSLIALYFILIFFIPRFGMLGLGIGLCLGGGISFSISWYLTEKLIKLKFRKNEIFLNVILLFSIALLQTVFPIPLPYRISMVLIFILSHVLLNKEYMIYCYNKRVK